MKKPPCSEWKLWAGPEIEGFSARGEYTLFVRAASLARMLEELQKRKISRVWFCKEYFDGRARQEIEQTITKLMQAIPFLRVCAEVPLSRLDQLSWLSLGWAKRYVKIDIDLSDGDHVCVGSAFGDEAFRIGDGVRVTPDMYLKDVFIE